MRARSNAFPKIEARNLTGRICRILGALDGDRSVLVVAFRRWQQRLVDGWLSSLVALEAQVAGLRVYELPTISSAWSPVRWFIDGGMTRGIPDRDAWARTLTSCTDVGRVLGALGLSNTETIAVVLVERSGRIAWQGGGRFHSGQLQEVSATLGLGPEPPDRGRR